MTTAQRDVSSAKWYKIGGLEMFLDEDTMKLLQSVGFGKVDNNKMDGVLFTPKAETFTHEQVKNWIANSKNGELDMRELFKQL